MVIFHFEQPINSLVDKIFGVALVSNFLRFQYWKVYKVQQRLLNLTQKLIMSESQKLFFSDKKYDRLRPRRFKNQTIQNAPRERSRFKKRMLNLYHENENQNVQLGDDRKENPKKQNPLVQRRENQNNRMNNQIPNILNLLNRQRLRSPVLIFTIGLVFVIIFGVWCHQQLWIDQDQPTCYQKFKLQKCTLMSSDAKCIQLLSCLKEQEKDPNKQMDKIDKTEKNFASSSSFLEILLFIVISLGWLLKFIFNDQLRQNPNLRQAFRFIEEIIRRR